MNPFEAACRAIASAEGYMMDSLSLATIGERDSLQISLRWCPPKPDLSLSLQGIYHFEISRFPDDEHQLLDRIIATPLLPGGDVWPDELNLNVVRSPDLPPLLWIRTEGPVLLNIVAAIVVVHHES